MRLKPKAMNISFPPTHEVIPSHPMGVQYKIKHWKGLKGFVNWQNKQFLIVSLRHQLIFICLS